jgi:hypothetical protein
LSTIQLNGTSSFTLVPAQTSINIADQILSDGATFLLTETFDPVQNMTVEDFIFTTLPPPQAASTSIITISDVAPAPNGTFGSDFLGEMFTDPPIPTVAIPAATGTAFVATQTTNVVYYTAYEVETEQVSTDLNGQVYCQTSTATYDLPNPYAYEYDGTDLGESPTQTGDVLVDFVNMIPQSSCTAGSWIALPTMIVVVEVTYQRGFAVFIVHHEVSDDGSLDVPTTSTDDGSAATTDSPPAATSKGGSTGGGLHVVPAVAHVEGQSLTVLVTVTGNPASATVTVGNTVVTASVIGGGSGSGSGGSGSGGGGGVASAIVEAIGGGTPATTGGSVASNIINALGGDSSGSGSGSGGSGAGSGSSGGSVNGVGFAGTGSSGSSGSSGGSGSGAAAVPVLTIDGTTVVGNAATQFLVAPGQTLTPGGTAVVGINTVSLAPGATELVINGVTSQIAAPAAAAATPAPTLNIGGQVVTANAGGSFIVAGQTLTQGGQITVSGNTVSLAQGATALVVNGQTITRPAVTAAAAASGSPILTIDGTTIKPATGGESFIIGGQTLTPGGVITANGNTISLGTGATPSIAVVNGVTQTLHPIITPAAINVAGTQFTELPGGSFVIGSQTLHPGGQITVSGTTLSLGPSASFIVVNGKTSSIALGTIPALVLGGTTYAATSAVSGGYIFGGQTLTPGGVITVNGHTISLAAGGTALVIDGSTSFINAPASITSPPELTINGHTYDANAGTTFTIDGQLLSPGGVITVDGTTISLAPGATAIVINGKTTTLFPATATPKAVSALGTKSATTTPKPSGTLSGIATATTTKKGAAPAFASVSTVVVLSALFAAIQLWI